MAGIKDVAQYCGLSPSTVSRTLTGSAFVEPETRKRVLEAVRALNYKPNMAARTLKSGATRLIGLIIPDIVNPYYPQVVKSLEELAMDAGYSIILCDAQGDERREKNYFEALQRLCVDGILYVPSTENVDAAREYAQSIPMVIINRTFDIDVPCITISNEDATYAAVRYLIDKGHERVALFINDTNRQYNAERMSGCRKAFHEAGIAAYERYITSNLRDDEDMYKRTVALMRREDRPTAIFIFNDNMALSVYRGIYDSGLRIPDDVSVIGFDDIPTSKFLTPPLTTMRHATYDTTKIIFNNLLSQIKTREFGVGSVTYYKAKLMERDSVRDIRP